MFVIQVIFAKIQLSIEIYCNIVIFVKKSIYDFISPSIYIKHILFSQKLYVEF